MKVRSLMQEQDIKPLPVPDASGMIPRVHGRILNSKRYNTEMAKFRELQGVELDPASGLDNKTGGKAKKKLSPVPNDAARKAHEYYLNKGVPAHVSAGIVSNFFWESGMNPNAEEKANTAEGRGYAQWNKNNRWLEYKNWAKNNNRDFKDGNAQLDYALVEAKQRGDYDKVLNASTPEQAALVWSDSFERPNPELANNDMRQATSRLLYDEKKPKKLAYGGHIGRPSYAVGGALPFNSIGQIGSGLVDTFNKKDSVTGNVFSGILSGGGTGASIGSMFGPIGTGVGAVVGATIGGITKGVQAKKRHEEEAYAKMLAQTAYTDSEYVRSQGVMATQPENYGGYSFYKRGGRIGYCMAQGGQVPQQESQEPYEAEKGEVIQGDAQLEAGTQHASDMHEVGGRTHEQGGTMGVGGNIVFSDRIIIGDQLAEAITKMGIPVDKKHTYAEVALKLAKLKGKAEERAETTDRIKGTTATANIAKVSQLTEILFAMQEQYKQGGTFAYGGHIRRFDNGGGIRKKMSMGSIFDGNISTMPNYNNTINSTIDFNPTNRSNLPINRTGTIPYSSVNGVATPMTVSPGGDVAQAVGQAGQGIDWEGAIGQITPYVSSVVGYMRNRNSIKKMNTNPNVNLLTNPNYTYNDRSYDAVNDVDTQMRNLQKSIVQNGGSASAQAALFAKGLEAKNKIRYNENLRRDTYNSGYANQVNATNQANVGMVNNRNEVSRNDKNQQQALLMQADNALLENLNTVTAENNQKQSDVLRMMYLQKMYNIGRGTGDYDEQERNKRVANGTGSFLDRYENRVLNRRSIFNS